MSLEFTKILFDDAPSFLSRVADEFAGNLLDSAFRGIDAAFDLILVYVHESLC